MDKNKFEWIFNRFKLMSFSEIIHRALTALKIIYSKKKRLQKEKQIKSFTKFNKYYFDDLSHIVDYYSSNEDLKNKLFENADKILNHKISIFSLKDLDLGSEIDWHKDYSLNKVYPKSFYSDLNFRDYNLGDIKFVWELNRFQHLFPLAQAYILSDDEKYASEIINQITDWIDTNPYLIGVNWASSLEQSLRLISWSWALFSLYKKDYKIIDAIKEKISTSIYQQAEFIYKNLSLYSSANNHLIGEAIGLAVIGTLFDYGKDSINWQKKGIKLLFKELEKQIFDDGLSREQAFNYHCVVLNMFLTTFVLLEKNNINIPAKYWSKIEKMVDCIVAFSDENFNLPRFGDADDSFLLKLDNDFDNDLPVQKVARYILNTSSIIFKKQSFNYLTKKKLDETTLWIMDEDKIKEYLNYPVIPISRKSLYFEKSGYMLLKDKNVNAFIDIGKLGYLSIAAHGHADALSLCLNYKSIEFLTDSGTFAYHTEPKWRHYFKSTAAHNTIEVDGQNQSQIGGSFMWLKKAETFIDEAIIGEEFDYVKAYHNGYIKQNNSVIHQRELLFMKDKFILVIDRLTNKNSSPHQYSLHWHLDANCVTKLNSESNLFEIINQNEKIFIKTFSDIPIGQQIIKGSENPIMGWTSRIFNVKNESESIKINFESSSSPIITSVIYFDEKIKFNYSNRQIAIQYNDKTYNYQIEALLK